MRNPHEECVTQKGLLKHSAQDGHTRKPLTLQPTVWHPPGSDNPRYENLSPLDFLRVLFSRERHTAFLLKTHLYCRVVRGVCALAHSRHAALYRRKSLVYTALPGGTSAAIIAS